jgi:hypothetical protein
MVERRRGGEVGVAAVQCLRGRSVWEAAAAGRWSSDLATAALARTASISQHDTPEAGAPAPTAFLIEYRDGLRATVLMLDQFISQFAFAARVSGEIVSTLFYLQSTEPFGHFAFLVSRFEDMVLGGRPPYPVERTVLTTGVLDFLMRSAAQGGARLETSELGVAYSPDTQS